MVVLVSCKNEEDPIKMNALVFTTLYINFSDAQGQIQIAVSQASLIFQKRFPDAVST